MSRKALGGLTLTPDVIRIVMSAVGAKGGKVRSFAKGAASRLNGAKGGRRPNAVKDAEEAAYAALVYACSSGASAAQVSKLVKVWVRACGRYRHVARTKWQTAFGDVTDYVD
jgi:hypothetical protein